MSSRCTRGKIQVRPIKYLNHIFLKASRINEIKKSHRSDLSISDWNTGDYANSKICETLQRVDHSIPGVQPVEVVMASDISPDAFHENFAMRGVPVIIRGALKEWRAVSEDRWSMEKLLARFKHTLFKVGEDDNGRKLRLKLKSFADYMKCQTDDSPLYLFESGMDGATASLRDDYCCPEYFPDDYLNLVGRENKPPHKWFCIGPKRSGTTVHRDPMGTSAWNALTYGTKRWVLFEPHENRLVVKGKKHRRKGEDDEAIHYFDYLLPRLRADFPSLKVYECVQEAGDIIFVPGQWWHGVLNLTDTIAVTHNYCGRDNFDDVCKRTSRQRSLFFSRWLKNMKRFSPVLYQRAIQLKNNPHLGRYVDCESSSSSSDSSDSSDYSSSEAMSDLDWVGFPARTDL